MSEWPQQTSNEWQYGGVEVEPTTNGWGLAGFIVSLVGICSGGVLAPIALLLSLIGLTRRPRGFAIAGFVLGLLGCLLLVVMIVGFSRMRGMAQAMADIQVYIAQNGELPDDAEGTRLIQGRTDFFGNQWHYEVVDKNTFQLISPGFDGQLGTADDMKFPVVDRSLRMDMNAPVVEEPGDDMPAEDDASPEAADGEPAGVGEESGEL